MTQVHSSVKRILIFGVGKTKVSKVFEDVLSCVAQGFQSGIVSFLQIIYEECGKKSLPCLFPKYIFLHVQNQAVFQSNTEFWSNS